MATLSVSIVSMVWDHLHTLLLLVIGGKFQITLLKKNQDPPQARPPSS